MDCSDPWIRRTWIAGSLINGSTRPVLGLKRGMELCSTIRIAGLISYYNSRMRISLTWWTKINKSLSIRLHTIGKAALFSQILYSLLGKQGGIRVQRAGLYLEEWRRDAIQSTTSYGRYVQQLPVCAEGQHHTLSQLDKWLTGWQSDSISSKLIRSWRIVSGTIKSHMQFNTWLR